MPPQLSVAVLVDQVDRDALGRRPGRVETVVQIVDGIGVRATVDRVVATVATQEVVAGATVHRVVAGTAEEIVVTAGAHQRVVTGAGVQIVSVAIAGERVPRFEPVTFSMLDSVSLPPQLSVAVPATRLT